MCKEYAFDFLYSMAASRDILLWPQRVQLPLNNRKQGVIPKTTTFHSENPGEHCDNANVYENIDHVMY